jgi:RNase H-fold protein (predicted Holliday junction resolvase)
VKGNVDKISATLILQNYMQAKGFWCKLLREIG